MRKIIVCLFFTLGYLAYAQAQLPTSNIYLFDLIVADTSLELTQPRYLTYFNENGYNNQPAFFSEDELYITVQMPYENQTDIYMLDLINKTKTKITATVEGEFSPNRTPDFFSFSAIRQEFRGLDTIQRLWQFPIDRKNNGKPVFKYTEKIGYYHWLSNSLVALYIVDDPNYLAIANTGTDKLTPIVSDPGRCFKRTPNGELAFVQKKSPSNWTIVTKNLYRNSPLREIINTLPGSEDFEILPDGTFLMGNGSKLYKFHPSMDEEWVEIADLRFYEITNISRLAVSDDMKLALVAD